MTGNDRQIIAGLSEAFRARQLEVIVGAGASMASGLPSWDELVTRLVADYIRSSESWAPSLADARAAARVLASQLGREAVVDVVRAAVGQSFVERLRAALYQGQLKAVSSLHLELAAMAVAQERVLKQEPPGMFTFNFDDLLERAMRQVSGDPDTKPQTLVDGERPPRLHVVHLHGYVPFDPASREKPGNLILSELDYHEAPNDWASRKLNDLFEKEEKQVLLVGLSLVDPRLRSLLIERAKRRALNKPSAKSSRSSPARACPRTPRSSTGSPWASPSAMRRSSGTTRACRRSTSRGTRWSPTSSDRSGWASTAPSGPRPAPGC